MTGTRVGPASAQGIPKTSPRQRLSSKSPTAQMPSPRPSPALPPRSPLSPQLERFDPLRPPSPRNMASRPGNSQRRANTATLKLPSLPRFHPANFASTDSSAQSTPEASAGSPQPPMSPRTHQRVFSDAQRQLFAYQREMLSAARAATPAQLDDPESPRLIPLGSPGPVTPLQLENEGGDYLAAGVRPSQAQPIAPQQLMDRLVKEESTRQRASLSRHSNRP